MPNLVKVSAITLRVRSMARSIHFYRDILGLKLLYGGENTDFSSLYIKGTYLNLHLSLNVESKWGRIIFYCDGVDKMHEHLRSYGYDAPSPVDAPWGERFFHINDPDGHELSFAKPLKRQ